MNPAHDDEPGPPAPVASEPQAFELEPIPELERKSRHTSLERFEPPATVAVTAADVDGGLVVPDPVVPPPVAVVEDARRQLIAYRRSVDAAVRAKHLATARGHHREARLWASAMIVLLSAPLAGMWAAGASGIVAYLVLWLVDGSFLIHVLGCTVPAGVAVLTRIAWTGGLPGSALDLILFVGVAAAPWVHRWLTAPMPYAEEAASVDATGKLTHQGSATTVAELAALKRHHAAVTEVNGRMLALVRRLTTVRVAAAGACIGFLGYLMAGLNGWGEITATGILAQGCVGAAAGAWIGASRPGELWSMLGYGLASVLAYGGLLVSGLAAFNLFEAMWVIAGWPIAGLLLGQALGVEEDVSPQRTT